MFTKCSQNHYVYFINVIVLHTMLTFLSNVDFWSKVTFMLSVLLSMSNVSDI